MSNLIGKYGQRIHSGLTYATQTQTSTVDEGRGRQWPSTNMKIALIIVKLYYFRSQVENNLISQISPIGLSSQEQYQCLNRCLTAVPRSR